MFSPASLPYANAALFVLLLLVNVKEDAFSPARAPNSTPDIPIAPAPYAFLIWLVIYVFTAAHVFTDCFERQFSIYEASPKPIFLRLCFSATCVLNIAWIVLNNWLQWINVATLDLMVLTATLAPIYLFVLEENLSSARSWSWRRYFASALAIRLYFSWVCAATLLCLTVSLQDLSGAYLSFDAYAFLLAATLVLALCGVVYGDDPVIGLVATWALIGLASREDVSEDPNHQYTAELIRASAKLAAPILPTMIVVALVRRHLLDTPRAAARALDLELAKPIGSYQANAGYGATREHL